MGRVTGCNRVVHRLGKELVLVLAVEWRTCNHIAQDISAGGCLNAARHHPDQYKYLSGTLFLEVLFC